MHHMHSALNDRNLPVLTDWNMVHGRYHNSVHTIQMFIQ